MGRARGVKNKSADYLSYYSKLPTDERIKFLARIAVDLIQNDLKTGGKLLSKIEKQSYG